MVEVDTLRLEVLQGPVSSFISNVGEEHMRAFDQDVPVGRWLMMPRLAGTRYRWAE